jgi:hypothetical protein
MFVDSENKRAIRERWNLPFLTSDSTGLGRPLAYLGLPGGSLNDLIDWGSVLGVKTCVQIVRKRRLQREEDLEIVSEMAHNILVRDIRHAEIIRGAIEDVILNGHGIDGIPPKLVKDEPSGLLFRYDIYNLDFLGGIMYRRPSQANTGQKSPRIKALEQLFARQRGHSFSLLLTLNVRDTFGDEPVQFLQEAAQRSQNDLLKEVAAWGAGLDAGFKQHQLRLWVPLWMRELAEMQNFRCKCLPAIAYTGYENAKMIHFGFKFEFVAGRELRVQSLQTAEEVLNLPMLTVEDGNFFYCVSTGAPCVINNPLPGPLTSDKIAELLSSDSAQ